MQERIAGLLGFEAALFVSSGTQSNLCALLTHCGRGDEYIAGQMAHLYRWEGGGAAVLGGIQPQPLAHRADGTLDPEAETVIINSGDGLKTLNAVSERVGPKTTIPPRYEAFTDFWKEYRA